jgi:hypothetical protein
MRGLLSKLQDRNGSVGEPFRHFSFADCRLLSDSLEGMDSGGVRDGDKCAFVRIYEAMALF